MPASSTPARASTRLHALLGVGARRDDRAGTRTEAIIGPCWLRRVGPLLLIVGSAWAGPLGTVSALTITGDRLLGLAALAVLAVLGVRGRLRWTSVHTALAVFVAVQVLTTALNARAWPQGPKFVTIYLLGFSCFALAAECARGADGQRRTTRAWIAVGVILSVVGTVMGDLSNHYQEPLWGTGEAQSLFPNTEYERVLFGAKVTFNEWNLFSSFLLIPFSLGLWAWRRDTGGQWRLVGALGAMIFGLVAGIMRAAWLSMAGIIALWCRLRRPRARQVAALGLMYGGALLVQALALGAIPLWSRLFEQRSNIEHRFAIDRVTVESWLAQPVPGRLGLVLATQTLLLGHGAGSVNRLSMVFPRVGRVQRIWNGNLVLFVLHDSGLLGLATLVWLFALVCRRAAPAIRRDAGRAAPSLTVPLLASGGALCFAYQFTHGLWLMYPYVYLGFLTAVTETGSDESGRTCGRSGSAPTP